MTNTNASNAKRRRVGPRLLIDWVKRRRTYIVLHSTFKHVRLGSHSHDEIYGEEYFEMVDQTSGRSAGIIASSIAEQIEPKSILDVGCGAGNLMEALRDHDVKLLGLEYASDALRRCHVRDLPVEYFDATDKAYTGRRYGRFDLAVSLEVAIQLPPAAANDLIKFLCSHSDTVLFSSPPCSRDRRPQSPRTSRHWINEFAKHGFEKDDKLSGHLKSRWEAEKTATWFSRDPMIFRNTARNHQESVS